jgi:membrane fusion protein (multidrug efflux system)
VKTTKLTATLAIVLMLFLTAAGLGCGQGDHAEASTDKGQDAGNTGGADDEAIDAEDADTDKAAGEEDDEDEEEAVPVEVAVLEQGEIEAVLRFSSNLEAEDQVQVFSQAKRLVRELLVEEGDRVAREQVLVRLQDEEQRSQLEKVKSQLAKAERDHERQARLHEQKLVSDQVYSEAQFEYEQLVISVQDAERELSYTEVRAPIAGTVTERMVKVGDQVQIGQHLFDIVDFESMVARVFVPEKHLRQLRPGLEARLSTAATGDKRFVAGVDRISPIVDPKSGTVKVTLAVGAQPGLRPGLYVDVDLVTARHREAVLVPKQAVVYDADQMFVYRLGDERRVERVFVDPLLSDKSNVEPRDGLVLGDQVVVAGQAGLKDNALVRLPGDKKDNDEVAADEITETAERIDG